MSEKKNGESQEMPEKEKQDESEFSSAAKPKQVTLTDEELIHMQKEIHDYKDKYLRSLADMENSYKRMQKDKLEYTNYAVESVIVDFLHPIDNLENALKFAQEMSDEVKNWAFGFQMILTQFKDILASNGIVQIETANAKFDPHLHEAVEMVETDDHLPDTIVEVCVRGYKKGERTIRPARVKVAKKVQKDFDKNSK